MSAVQNSFRLVGSYLILSLLMGCLPPGRGRKARAGYDTSRPIIAALESYRATNGVYPDSLVRLGPSFSSGQVSPYLDKDIHARYRGVRYNPDSNRVSYELTFTYTGPGLNWCVYSSKKGKWACRGLY